MTGLFGTLMRPDREEHPEKAEIARAANALQVGEFQFLQLAYHAWHHRELPSALVDSLFAAYMIKDQVPHWARHYARKILDLDGRGLLNWRDPRFHRYDPDYVKPVSNAVRKFWLAAVVIFGLLGTGLVLAHYSTQQGGSILPPYFDNRDAGPRGPNPTP